MALLSIFLHYILAYIGVGSSQLQIAEYFWKRNQSSKAAYWCIKAAKNNQAWAQHLLGVFHLIGFGVDRDYAKAIEWWKVAAENGCADSQNNLGMAYKNGDCVEQNSEKAVYWWKKAAEAGIAESQAALATAYLHGIGIGKDIGRAAHYYELAWPNADDDLKEQLLVIAKELTDAECDETKNV